MTVESHDYRFRAFEHADDDRPRFEDADVPAFAVAPIVDHLARVAAGAEAAFARAGEDDHPDAGVGPGIGPDARQLLVRLRCHAVQWRVVERSEEHTSELQSLMRNSYAVFCL